MAAQLFTPEQVAQRLSTGRTTVFRLMRSGQLASVKIGRARRVPATALDDYIAGLLNAPTSAVVNRTAHVDREE